jgi:hypothetical protein
MVDPVVDLGLRVGGSLGGNVDGIVEVGVLSHGSILRAVEGR